MCGALYNKAQRTGVAKLLQGITMETNGPLLTTTATTFCSSVGRNTNDDEQLTKCFASRQLNSIKNHSIIDMGHLPDRRGCYHVSTVEAIKM